MGHSKMRGYLLIYKIHEHSPTFVICRGTIEPNTERRILELQSENNSYSRVDASALR